MRAAEGAYDLAIVSLEWPDANGVKLCRQLRLVDPTASLRLLLVTGGEEMQLRRIEGSGADDLLLRPIDRNEAIARVRVAARKSQIATTLRKIQAAVERPVQYGQYGVSSLNRPPPDRFAA
jgi:two-component system cell cycle response regulator